jgi:hypothetical protein
MLLLVLFLSLALVAGVKDHELLVHGLDLRWYGSQSWRIPLKFLSVPAAGMVVVKA